LLPFRNVGDLFGSNVGWIRVRAAIGCGGTRVHSLVDFNLHIMANAAWFAALAGIASSDDRLAIVD
jgi:hypothetical protein